MEYNVFESKFAYCTYKEILFTGTIEECITFIACSELNLEMLPM